MILPVPAAPTGSGRYTLCTCRRSVKMQLKDLGLDTPGADFAAARLITHTFPPDFPPRASACPSYLRSIRETVTQPEGTGTPTHKILVGEQQCWPPAPATPRCPLCPQPKHPTRRDACSPSACQASACPCF